MCDDGSMVCDINDCPTDDLAYIGTPEWDNNNDGVLDNYNDYENNGSITAMVTIEGGTLSFASEGDMIAAFVNGEQRGVALANQIPFGPYQGDYQFQMMIYSNETSGELLTFQYFDLSGNAVYNMPQSLEFESNMIVGNVVSPYTFIFNPGLGDIFGCTDQEACNYYSFATQDDGSCLYAEENFDCNGNCLFEIDECGVCAGDNSTCEDCAGIPNGDSVEDECGVCDSLPWNDCEQDCNGDWGGSAVVDECGECGGDNSTCEDCAGIPNGDAVEDECGVCDSLPWNDCEQDCNGDWGGSALEDCAGICNGSAVVDECGECGGGGPENNFDCDGNCIVDVDCNGECGGSAQLDECGICDGSGLNEDGCCGDELIDCEGVCGGESTEDCNGECNGLALIDECGICNGPGPEFICNDENIVCEELDCAEDCAGIPNGDSIIDPCGTCDSDLDNDCEQDCNGAWGGDAFIDDCGECVESGTNPDDCLSSEIAIPDKLYLGQNYPNPFNPVSTVNYGISIAGNVNISLYDLKGRKVKQFIDSFHTPGYYSLSINSRDLISSVYILQLKSLDDVQTKKIAVIK